MGSVRRVGLIGRLDPEGELFDGQTVKTRMMHRLLCELYGEGNVYVVDTKDYRHNAARVAAQTAKCLLMCRDVFVSLSRNGRKAFFPLLSFAARHLRTRVYHNLIGGWLARDLGECPQAGRLSQRLQGELGGVASACGEAWGVGREQCRVPA